MREQKRARARFVKIRWAERYEASTPNRERRVISKSCREAKASPTSDDDEELVGESWFANRK